jgi:hypothetical protein
MMLCKVISTEHKQLSYIADASTARSHTGASAVLHADASKRTCRTLQPFSEQDIFEPTALKCSKGKRREGAAHTQNRWEAREKSLCSQLGGVLWRKQDFRSCWNDCRRQLDRMGWGRIPSTGTPAQE